MRRLISNSLLSIAALLYAGLGCANSATPSGSGNLRVATTTTGTPPDADGYLLQIDRSSAAPSGQRLGANANATLADLPAGTHQLGLLDVAVNCLVSGANPRPVTIVADSAVDAAFEIHCAPPPAGAIRVVAVTSGPVPDPDGYTVALTSPEVYQVATVGANDSVTISDLAVGRYTVALSTGIAVNCAVTGNATRQITVVAGDTARSTFQVACGNTGNLQVSAATSGGRLDPDGYLLHLDGDAGRPLSSNGTVVLTALTPGGHTLELTGVATNCGVRGANPRTVAVVAGVQTAIDFQLDCVFPLSGNLLFTSDRSGVSHIWSLNGTGLSDLTPGAEAADGDWSPNGSKIVFSSTRDGDSEIYVMVDADGSNPVRLTTTDALAEGPRWSPDGTRITFFYFGHPGSVVVMNADGSGLSVLSQGQQPSWSPDGTRIVFWREDPSHCLAPDVFCLANIYTMASDGSQVQKLTQNADLYRYPVWSPDGKTIAYTTAFSRGVYVMNANGTGTRLIANLPNGGRSPVWSPDGAVIAFETGQPFGNTTEIRVVPAGGGPSETLASGPGYNRPTSWKQ